MGPFIQKDMAIATDAHAIVSFDKILLKEIDFVSHEKAPNALRVIPEVENIKVVFQTAYLRKLIGTSNEATSKKYRKDRVTCPDCYGNGEVTYEFHDRHSNRHIIESECPSCEGYGKTEVIVDPETNHEVVEGFKELLLWQDTYFQTAYVDRLVKVAELLGLTLLSLTYRIRPTSVHKFSVGECTVCLMPVMASEEGDIVTIIQ